MSVVSIVCVPPVFVWLVGGVGRILTDRALVNRARAGRGPAGFDRLRKSLETLARNKSESFQYFLGRVAPLAPIEHRLNLFGHGDPSCLIQLIFQALDLSVG